MQNRRARQLASEEGLQTLTPTRQYTEQRGAGREPPGSAVRSQTVIAGRGQYEEAVATHSADGDDWQSGFEMFVEKCADGSETEAELRRRWNALSAARQSTWTRLAR